MNKSIGAVLFFLACFTLMNCQKEIGGGFFGNENNPAGFAGTLQGNIIDENGQPAAGVSIVIDNKTTSSNDKGFFRIKNITLKKEGSVVIADKSGYFKAYRSFNATSGVNYVQIQLIKKKLIGTISNGGGSVSFSNGSSVALPENSTVKANGGAAYLGDINVYATYIDPTSVNINKIIPGSLMADDAQGKRVSLASYGMLAVELESTSGEKLQLAAGKEAKLTTKIPSSLMASAPAQIALWYVDEKTGIWKEEGSATKQGDSYVGNVKHFSFWNCDISVPSITLTVTLKNSDGAPLVYSMVKIRRLASYGEAYGYTDSSGRVSGLVPASENLRLYVVDPCGYAIDSINIGPFAKNTDVGTIVSTEVSSKQIRFTGKIIGCDGASVTKGYAVIYHNNNQIYSAVNQNGEFSIAIMNCQPFPQTASIIGVDDNANQQSSVASLSITNGIVNAGTIIACGNSSAQYINYKIDNNESLTVTDSLMAYSYQGYGQYSLNTTISGYKVGNSNQRVNIAFEHNAAKGTYPMLWVNFNNYNSATFTQPSNVTIINYPQSIGEFYEGSFTTKFKDTLGREEHAVTGTFRIRK